MVTETITIKGMHCDACEKTVRRALAKEGITVEDISYRNGQARITHGEVSEQEIQRALSAKGYSLGEHGLEDTPTITPVAQKKILKRAYDVEKRILTDGFLTLSILLVVQAVLALGIYSLLPGYHAKFLPVLLYLPLAIVVNIVALWHQYAYRGSVSCMTGMMIGMTIGMTTGFMVGALTGLSNGMFTGSVVATGAALAAGIYGGKCCGTMGIMEGMMAALMGGTMGAMITVMLVADHVWWFIPILFLICMIILGGLMQVIIKEHEGTDAEVKPWPMLNVLAVSFGVMLVISLIIVLAPKGLY